MTEAIESTVAGTGQQNWNSVAALPCLATLDVPVPEFTVSQLLELRQGTVVVTKWSAGAEIPVKVNRATVAWGELELLGDHLAVRLTELL
jgi:flagellar motor switch protein FliN